MQTTDKLFKKQEANRKRHNFLLQAFFKDVAKDYAVNTSVDGWVLVKHINGDTKEHEVAIYTEEAYEDYLKFNNKLF